MDSDSSETNLVIITKRDRLKLFWKLYWRILILILTPLIFLPVVLISKRKGYKAFYVFLISATYWIADVLHPAILSLLSSALFVIVELVYDVDFYKINLRNELLDAFSVMLMIVAIEKSEIHRRIAVKLLLMFGCSHYRLSFILFFTTMFLSMWVSDILGCGFMLPLTKAVLTELETMGILEIYETIGTTKQRIERHEQKTLRPTDFTVFYFLGIAYSSTIGSLATLVGSRSNQLFKLYSESLFPSSPAVEFPHIILLNLPGVLLMETLVYMWMNAYFLGMFRTHSDIAIEIGMTEEESQYIHTLLQTRNQELGKMKAYEIIVGTSVVLACILQILFNSLQIENHSELNIYLSISSPCLICAVLLFVTPINMDFIKIFKKQGRNNPLPTAPSKSCLNWTLAQTGIYWSVLFTIASSTATMEALKTSGMMRRIEKSLEALSQWPGPVLILVLIIFCKVITEFANNPCVVYTLLPSIARLSVSSTANPHYLMMAVTIACSLPFHLIPGSPVNALVAAYVHIPPWRMLSAGIGPSVIAAVVCWFTVAVWSRAIWPDIQGQPAWANKHSLFNDLV